MELKIIIKATLNQVETQVPHYFPMLWGCPLWILALSMRPKELFTINFSAWDPFSTRAPMNIKLRDPSHKPKLSLILLRAWVGRKNDNGHLISFYIFGRLAAWFWLGWLTGSVQLDWPIWEPASYCNFTTKDGWERICLNIMIMGLKFDFDKWEIKKVP